MDDIIKIIEDYREYAILHRKASYNGDYKTVNKNYDKLKKIYTLLFNNSGLREKILPQLLNDTNFAVKLWASAHSLGIGEYKEKALDNLEYISKLSSNDTPSFEAKMTLQEYKAKGYLRF